MAEVGWDVWVCPTSPKGRVYAVLTAMPYCVQLHQVVRGCRKGKQWRWQDSDSGQRSSHVHIMASGRQKQRMSSEDTRATSQGRGAVSEMEKQ